MLTQNNLVEEETDDKEQKGNSNLDISGKQLLSTIVLLIRRGTHRNQFKNPSVTPITEM